MIVVGGDRNGTVYDDRGTPISGVSVLLSMGGTRLPIATTATNSQGRWQFDGYALQNKSAPYRVTLIDGATTIEIEGHWVRVDLPPDPPRSWWRRMWGLS